MRKRCTLILKKIFDLNTTNDGASANGSPFHALIALGKNDCPYWLLYVVFSSSTLIRLDKGAFNGHLCQGH